MNPNQLQDMHLSKTDISHTTRLVESGHSVHAIFKMMKDMEALTGYTKSANDIKNALRKIKNARSFLGDSARHQKFTSQYQLGTVWCAKRTAIAEAEESMATAEKEKTQEEAYDNYTKACALFEKLNAAFPTVFDWYRKGEKSLAYTGGRVAAMSGSDFENRLSERDIQQAIRHVLSTTTSAEHSGDLQLVTNVLMQKRGDKGYEHFGEIDALLVDMTTGEVLLWIEQKANSGDLPKANKQREDFHDLIAQGDGRLKLSSDDKDKGPSQWRDGVCDVASCCKLFHEEEDGSNAKDILRRCIIITQLRTTSDGELNIPSPIRMNLYRNLFTFDITDDEQMRYLSTKICDNLVPASKVIELYRDAGALQSIIVVSQAS